MSVFTEKNIWFITAVLAAIAGYCDSVTFVCGNKIFSAHVTGNFVVFAFDLIRGADLKSWMRLITFPVFITSVLTAGWLARKSGNWQILLWIEGALLTANGLLDYFITKCGLLDFQWLEKHLLMVGSFLGGCLAGAFIGRHIGLCAVAMPGLVLVAVFRNAVWPVPSVENEKYSI